MKSMLVFLKAKYCGAKPWRLRLCNWVVEGLGAGKCPVQPKLARTSDCSPSIPWQDTTEGQGRFFQKSPALRTL